jgi:hypothetical protein
LYESLHNKALSSGFITPGERLLLFPATPRAWSDVDFSLRAWHNTTVTVRRRGLSAAPSLRTTAHPIYTIPTNRFVALHHFAALSLCTTAHPIHTCLCC